MLRPFLGVPLKCSFHAIPSPPGAASADVTDLQGPNKTAQKGTPPGWEDFSESSTDGVSDTDSGMGTATKRGKDDLLFSSSPDDEPIVEPTGSIASGPSSFQSSGAAAATRGRLNTWCLASIVLDRVLLLGFVAMCVAMIVLYAVRDNGE